MSKIRNIDLEAQFDDVDGVIITLDDGSKIKFGISMYSHCCEHYDYLHTVDKPEEFIGADYLGLVEKDTWPAAIEQPYPDYGFDGSGFQAIDVNTSRGVMQFVVYNSHNGYYSHSTLLSYGDVLKQERL